VSVLVLTPGMQSTVQDAGRPGHRALGVSRAGAADRTSFELANRLAGNDPGVAGLELAWSGPRLRFESPCVVALAGAEIEAHTEAGAVPMHRPVALGAGATLELGAIRGGARTYLAVAGGFDVPNVLGSASTDLTACFGGIDGRPLRKGDVLRLCASPQPVASQGPANWWIAAPPHLPRAGAADVRVLPGAHGIGLLERLCGTAWRVSADASRMGLRLEGASIEAAQATLTSEPVTIGTVQLPPSGQPIVLGVDAQTVGGYPRIAHVIAADWPVLGQLRPGDRLRFVTVDGASARAALGELSGYLARVGEAIRARRTG